MSEDKPGRKNVYSCHVCGKKFTNLEKLKVHLNIHSKEAHKQSETSDKTLREKDELMKNSLQKNQACSLSSTANNINKELSTHFQLESLGIEEREVSEGTRSVKNVKHNLSKDKNEKCVSEEEGKAVFKKASLRSHFRSHAKEKNSGSEVCDKANSTEHNLLAIKKENSYSCEMCGKTFTRNSKLKEHSLAHSDEKPFVCEVCNRGFTRKHDLKNHQLIHTKVKSHICENCGKEFGHKSNLTRHLRTHTKEKPYTCEICKRNFTRSSHLKVHALVHTNEKPHICEVCGKSFARKDYLASHLRIHTKDKSYICGICNKGFTQKSALEYHLLIHKNEKPHFCKFCGKAFRSKGNLISHFRVHTK